MTNVIIIPIWEALNCPFLSRSTQQENIRDVSLIALSLLNSISEKAKLTLWYIIFHNTKLTGWEYFLAFHTERKKLFCKMKFTEGLQLTLISPALACGMFCIPFTGFTPENMLLKIFQVSIKITCRIYSTQLFYCLHAHMHTAGLIGCLSSSYACRGWLVSAQLSKVGQKPFEDTERKRTKEWAWEREGGSEWEMKRMRTTVRIK